MVLIPQGNFCILVSLIASRQGWVHFKLVYSPSNFKTMTIVVVLYVGHFGVSFCAVSPLYQDDDSKNIVRFR